MIDVVKRIKDLMEMRGWTCYELSAQTGISTNAIYDWFKIGAEPSLSNIVKICEAMGISLELFARGANSAEGFLFLVRYGRFGHSPLAGVAGMLCRRTARF